MFCPSCGTKNDETSRFCESCGAAINDPVPATAAPVPPAPATVVSTPPAAAAAQGAGMTAKIGIVIGIIGIFFFGIILGPIAIVLGYMGYSKGDRSIGAIAMIVGVVALIVSLATSAILL